jgi:hypothetical protein
MKRSLKHILAASALLFAGVSTSLFGTISDEVTQWIFTDWSDFEKRADICQNIGKKGRLLGALPQRTRLAILDKCEGELLGLRWPEVSRSRARDSDITDKDVHPNAWRALAKNTTKWPKSSAFELADNDDAPRIRREELIGLRTSIRRQSK